MWQMDKPLDVEQSQAVAKQIKSKGKASFENAHRAALVTEDATYVQGFLVYEGRDKGFRYRDIIDISLHCSKDKKNHLPPQTTRPHLLLHLPDYTPWPGLKYRCKIFVHIWPCCCRADVGTCIQIMNRS